MTELVDMSAEKKKRMQPCVFCGRKEEHPGYSCPRIASLMIDEDGHIWQVEFHDWQGEQESEGGEDG